MFASIRRQAALFVLSLITLAGLVTVSGPTQAHAWNTYNSSCSSETISLDTGGYTTLCFDLTGTYLGSNQWRLRESGWTSDGVTLVQWHFNLRDWLCNRYDPPDYNYTSGSQQWSAISEIVITSCGAEMDSGNSWGGTGDIAASRGVSTFSVWN